MVTTRHETTTTTTPTAAAAPSHPPTYLRHEPMSTATEPTLFALRFFRIRRQTDGQYLTQENAALPTLTFAASQATALRWTITVPDAGDAAAFTATIRTIEGGERHIVRDSFALPFGYRLSLNQVAGKDVNPTRYSVVSDHATVANGAVVRELREFGASGSFMAVFAQLVFEPIDEFVDVATFDRLDAYPSAQFPQCSDVMTTKLSDVEEPAVSIYTDDNCSGSNAVLAPGKYATLGTVPANATRHILVPENMTATFFDGASFTGASTTYAAGLHTCGGGSTGCYASVVVERVLPWFLFQVSMCDGAATGTLSDHAVYPNVPNRECDVLLTDYCAATGSVAKSCNCIRETTELAQTLADVGLGDLALQMPVACFGADCAADGGYLTSVEERRTCDVTICTAVQNTVGEAILSKDNVQNLSCGNNEWFKDGEFVNDVPTPTTPTPTPTVPTPTPTPTPTPDAGGDAGLPSWALPVIIAGSVAVLALVLYLALRKRAPSSSSSSSSYNDYDYDDDYIPNDGFNSNDGFTSNDDFNSNVDSNGYVDSYVDSNSNGYVD
jgi:hypothetical protein